MTDLHTEYLGLALRSPIVASSGPYTGEPDRWREIEDAGAGAMAEGTAVSEAALRKRVQRLSTDLERRILEAVRGRMNEADWNELAASVERQSRLRGAGRVSPVAPRIVSALAEALDGGEPGGSKDGSDPQRGRVQP